MCLIIARNIPFITELALLCTLLSCASFSPSKGKIRENIGNIDLSRLDSYSSKELLQFTENLYQDQLSEHNKRIENHNAQLKAPAPFDSTKVINNLLPPDISFGKIIDFLNTIILQRTSDRMLDRFIYFRAFCYQEQGEMEKAAKGYLTIIEKFPESPLITEVRFRLGEHYFNAEEFTMATKMYSMVLIDKKSHFIDKALYKLGWVYYLKQDYKEGANYFFQLADHSFQETLAPHSGRDLNAHNLGDEGITYAAACISRIESASQAIKNTKKASYTKYYFVKLAKAYFVQHKYSDVLELVDGLPYPSTQNPEGLELLYRISALRTLGPGDTLELIKKKEEFIQYFSPIYENTVELKQDDKKILSSILPSLLREIAHFYRRKGDSTREKNDYEMAYQYFNQILSLFPNSKDLPTISLFTADALFTLNRFQETIPYYEKLLSFPDAKTREAAAYGLLSSYEKLAKRNPSLQKSLIASEKQYVTLFPDNPKSGPLFLRQGARAFQLRQYNQAIDLFSKSRHLTKRKSNWFLATEYIADSLFNKGLFVEANMEYENLFKEALSSNNLEMIEKAQKFIPICQISIAEELKKNNNTIASAQRYETAASLFQNENDIQSALFQAMELYSSIKKWNLLDNAFANLKDRIGNPERRMSITISVAQLLQKHSQYKKAGQYFEMASVAADLESKTNIIDMAALNYERGGFSEESIRLFEHSSTNSAIEPSKRIEYRFRAAELWEISNQTEKAQKSYAAIVALYKDSEAGGHVPNPYFYGKTLIKALEREYSTFKKLELNPPFVHAFNKKLHTMEALIESIIEIEKLKVSELTTVALFQLGKIFENFSSTILSSPTPKGLTNEEREEYIYMLQEKAFPFEEQAVKAFEKVVTQTAADGDHYIYMGKSLSRLSRIRPALYKRTPEPMKRKVLIPSVLRFVTVLKEGESRESSTKTDEAKE